MWNDETGKAPDDAQGCEVMWVGTGRGEGQPAAARGAAAYVLLLLFIYYSRMHTTSRVLVVMYNSIRMHTL
jgi:hypothetical protein